MPEPSDQQVVEFSRHTRRRRLFFALTAFGATVASVIAALLLFGGQLQTTQKAQQAHAIEVLRARFESYRPRCRGLWRQVYAIDWPRIPIKISQPMAVRLAAGNVPCDEVMKLAQVLPRKAPDPAKRD